MVISTGDYAVALKAAKGWALKEICKSGELENGIGLRCGDEWVFAPSGEKMSDKLIAIDVGGEKVLTPLECKDDSTEPDPCTGNDPLCSLCLCESYLLSEYTVVISGFPDICGTAIFNGAWTVTHVQDCLWRYEIDEWNWVELAAQAGVQWRVSWGVRDAGGLGGYFAGYFGQECVPESHSYYYVYDFTVGCTGLRTALMSSVSVVVL